MGVTHHDGLSVGGSGYYVGKKADERTLLPTGLARVDAGSFSTSGWKNLSVSTKLSSVTWVVTQVEMPATGLAGVSSGFISVVGTTASGHCIDFTMYTVVSAPSGVGGCITSAGTSGKINWMAIGT